jgi:hypothetical protein
MTSLPVTPRGRMPVNVTFAIGGIPTISDNQQKTVVDVSTMENLDVRHHVRPVANMLAASDLTMGVP